MEDHHQHQSEPALSSGSKGVTQYICPMHPEVLSGKPGSYPGYWTTSAPRKIRKRTLRLATVALLAMLLASCGKGREQTEHKAESTVPQEQAAAVPSGKEQSATSNMHNPRSSLVNDFAHENLVILDSPYQLGAQARAEMDQVIHAYIQLAHALADDKENAADQATHVLSEKVGSVDPARLEGEGLDAWKIHQSQYVAELKDMLDSQGLEKKRSYFSHISEILYCTIKSFGLKKGALFAVFCPMAFDGKGAYWISESKEFRNPYFGKRMLSCGEIREEL